MVDLEILLQRLQQLQGGAGSLEPPLPNHYLFVGYAELLARQLNVGIRHRLLLEQNAAGQQLVPAVLQELLALEQVAQTLEVVRLDIHLLPVIALQCFLEPVAEGVLMQTAEVALHVALPEALQGHRLQHVLSTLDARTEYWQGLHVGLHHLPAELCPFL